MTDQVQTPAPGEPEPKPPTVETEEPLEDADGPATITISEPTLIVPEDDASIQPEDPDA